MSKTRLMDPAQARHYAQLFEGALADQPAPVEVSYVDGTRFWIEVGQEGAVYHLSQGAREGNTETSDQEEIRLMRQHIGDAGVLA